MLGFLIVCLIFKVKIKAFECLCVRVGCGSEEELQKIHTHLVEQGYGYNKAQLYTHTCFQAFKNTHHVFSTQKSWYHLHSNLLQAPHVEQFKSVPLNVDHRRTFKCSICKTNKYKI